MSIQGFRLVSPDGDELIVGGPESAVTNEEEAYRLAAAIDRWPGPNAAAHNGWTVEKFTPTGAQWCVDRVHGKRALSKSGFWCSEYFKLAGPPVSFFRLTDGDGGVLAYGWWDKDIDDQSSGEAFEVLDVCGGPRLGATGIEYAVIIEGRRYWRKL